MAFETFKRQRVPLSHTPEVTIQRKGIISINRPAYEALGEPEAVELLYDRERRLVGLRKVDVGVPYGYQLRSLGRGSTWLVSGMAFANYYGIDTRTSLRRQARIDDGMVVIDLNEPGIDVSGNRNRPGQEQIPV